MDLGLLNASVLVTGGSSGIGLETARLLIEEGALVTVCGRDIDKLRATKAAIDSPNLNTHRADIYDPVQAASAVAAAVEHGGGLDGVAAVAGRGHHGSLVELPTSDVVAEVSDKLLALLNIVDPSLLHLTRSRGRIVGLTAPTAAQPDPAMGAIGVGRAALDNAIAALAAELAPTGVAVNAVGVGIIDTPRQRSRHAEARSPLSYDDWLQQQAEQRSVPLGRPGTATEVATAVCWLLSPLASYTTGAILEVTGGLRSR